MTIKDESEEVACSAPGAFVLELTHSMDDYYRRSFDLDSHLPPEANEHAQVFHGLLSTTPSSDNKLSGRISVEALVSWGVFNTRSIQMANLLESIHNDTCLSKDESDDAFEYPFSISPSQPEDTEDLFRFEA